MGEYLALLVVSQLVGGHVAWLLLEEHLGRGQGFAIARTGGFGCQNSEVVAHLPRLADPRSANARTCRCVRPDLPMWVEQRRNRLGGIRLRR